MRQINDTWTNTVSSRAGNGSGCHSMSRKVHLRPESGNCNVCSVPCSSCMHFNRTLMGLKVDEFPDETCHRDADSQYSINEGDGLPPIKGRSFDNLQHTVSEPSNILGVTSIHDSFSENVESKANLRSSDISYASEGIEMCPKSESQDAHDLVPHSKKFENRSIEGHGDNISCASGSNDANIMMKYDNKNKQAKKLDDEVELHDVLEPPLQSISGYESDDSDIVEHDVKVCDICGDAGREDLLAVCSRCSDGAEHTYCMQEMLDKVPEDEWLCDECKLNEETEKQKQDKAEMVNENVKKQCPGQTSSTDLFVKLDTKDSDVEDNRTNKVIPRTHASRDSSFKNLDKGKVKLAHQMSFDTSTTSARFQTVRGNSLKSNSFNSLDNKPRVKPADDVIPHKEKGARELGSFDSKEGPLKMMSKSISFISANSARSSAPESKVKMLSPRFPHFQDIRGFRKAKERNTFERKNLSKSGAPMVSLAMASPTVSALKSDQKLSSRSESILHTSARNIRDSNPVPNLISPKEEPSTSSSQLTERPFISANDVEERLPSLQESTNQAERIEETLSRPSVMSGGRGVPCHRYKDTGHATDLCTIASPRASSVDASASRSSIEDVNTGNKLKAAIHAAMLKKPGIYKKNRVPDQSDELSLSSSDLNCEVASQDQFSASSHFRSTIAGKQEGQGIFVGNTSDSCKHSNINVKQVTVHPAESIYSFKTWDSDAVIPSDGKPNMKEFPSHAALMMSVFLKMSTIPEHEYIWQGDFEVHRSGKVPELCAGIQAHLSSCASPRVLDMVNKFVCRVPLTEVTRLSTWPTAFHDCGPTEDHIAIYFFAKDVESYERHYRILLESMMKNDVALKGSIDGVELLIFPSNQLPKKFQRWNMLFFLWGVFRASRVHCSDHMSNPSEKHNVSSLNGVTLDKNYPRAVMSFSEDLCSLRRTDEESSGCDRISSPVLKSNTSSSFKVSVLPSPETINGNLDCKLSSQEQMFSGFQAKSEQPDGRLDSQTLLRISASSTQLCTELEYAHTSQEANSGENCELQPPIPASNFYRSVDVLKDTQETLSPVKIHSVSSQEADSIASIGTKKILDRLGGTYQMKFEKNAKDEEGSDMEISPYRDTMVRDLSMKEASSWKLNHRKRPHFDPTETVSQASSSSCTIEEMPQDDAEILMAGGEIIIKKLKTESNENAIRDDIVSEKHDSGPSSSGKQIYDEAWDEMKTSEDPGYAERHFFPVVSHPVDEFRVGDSSISSDGEVSLRTRVSHDDVPNLDLALGAVDKQTDLERPPGALTTKKEEDEVTASLSLSLSFPFAEKERHCAAPKTEPLVSESRHGNTSFLLFKGFPDK